MKKVVEGSRVPIKLWLDDLEDGALEQAKNLASLPFVFRHVALMPDAHKGYGMPIGGVLATNGVVVPNAVGKDIGCGMCAVKTNLKTSDLSREILTDFMSKIRASIPLGFNKHSKKPDDRDEYMPNADASDMLMRMIDAAEYQIGTLGGGNHFIEFQADEDDNVWVMLHSGSRKLGSNVADHYDRVAQELNAQWHSSVPASHELAFLPIDSEEGRNYMRDMQYCVDYALGNRRKMMDTILKIVGEAFCCGDVFSFEPMINIAHNYARLENHFGKNVVVHRKGATSAREGEIGIIPGSQGSSSYIVRGLGNRESFMSCSHGAGRKLGRKAAKRELSFEDEKARLDSQGILHALRSKDDLEEASGAYKDIDVVIENENDLVSVVVKLRPLAVIKG